MADSARVNSIDSISDFRSAFWKFAETAKVALGDAESDLQRTAMWLENEQMAYWSGQIRKRHEAVTRAAEKVREKRLFKDFSGKPASAVDEERALKIAKARLEEAEGKLAAVKKYARAIQKVMHDYKGSVQACATAIAHDIPLAVARLDKLASLLRQYVELAPVGPAGADESGSTASPMTRSADVMEAPPAPPADDLPDFPNFESPHVVLVHRHRPTDLVLAADGKSIADEGNQYRPFASVEEAERYARVKVDAEPLVECLIYAADRTRVAIVSRESDPADAAKRQAD